MIRQHFSKLFFFFLFLNVLKMKKKKKNHLGEIYIPHIISPIHSPFTHCIIHCVFISC